ncbi:MAG TPA: hypothetical protein VFK26_11380 [Gemmatimonadaceae bacterium]|jgi:hypothetical protein|nr:hypothetical protein [Gemmatimonadaceae bacterium]HJQ54100.1 hypothetical protein [Gemmatimonadaceae bacterium]
MPARVLQIDGQQWNVYPSGYITQYTQDEYALLFSRGSGEDRQVRVTRYSPQGTRSREQAFAELSDAQLQSLFSQSQPSFTSPEAGYER